MLDQSHRNQAHEIQRKNLLNTQNHFRYAKSLRGDFYQETIRYRYNRIYNLGGARIKSWVATDGLI